MTITDFQWVHGTKAGAYLIENDGTDSTFWYSAAFPDAGATWTSTAITGMYTKIRVGSVPGVVYIAGENTGTEQFNYTVFGDDYNTSNGANTSIAIDSGDTVEITATGTWDIDQDPAPGANPVDADGYGYTHGSAIAPSISIGGLMARVGTTGAWTGIGINNSFVSAATGTLYLIANDIDNAPAYAPNTGSQACVIDVTGGDAVTTKYSTTYGASFGALVDAGDTPGPMFGIDVAKNSSVILVGTVGQVMKASAGGAYAAYGTTLPTDFVPAAIWIPRYQFTSSTTLNNATNPEYLIASNVADSAGESMYRVTAGGNTFTAVSPDFGGVGLAVSQDCIAMPHRSGKRISAVLDFSGSVKLVTSIDSGGSYLNRDTIVGALAVRYRRGDTSLQQLYVACAGGLVVSLNHGALLHTRLSPGPTALLGCEPFA